MTDDFDYPLKIYVTYNGCLKEYQPDECAYGNTWNQPQCNNPKGHGRSGLFCKQHAKKFPPLLPPSPNPSHSLLYRALAANLTTRRIVRQEI